jgi:hypothetical protein
VYKPGFYLSTDFLGDKSRIRKYFANSFELLLAGLLLGLRKRGLGNRQDGTHGRLQALKRSLWGRHGQHSTTFMPGGLQ